MYGYLPTYDNIVKNIFKYLIVKITYYLQNYNNINNIMIRNTNTFVFDKQTKGYRHKCIM